MKEKVLDYSIQEGKGLLLYLTKSDLEFSNTYVKNEKCWF